MGTVTERPILFSAPMILAILDGRKTVTRRVVNPQRDATLGPEYSTARFAAGDTLWVRETWRTCIDYAGERRVSCLEYRADSAQRQIADANESLWAEDHTGGRHGEKWRPSIFMRRWASRLTLEVLSVRVERLHEITEEDARAEGIEFGAEFYVGPPYKSGAAKAYGRAREAFADLWDTINGKRASWASNPWVWRVEFRRLP